MERRRIGLLHYTSHFAAKCGHGRIGIIIAALSLVVMPLLAGAKRRVAAGLGSPALAADASSTSTEPDWSTGARLAADGHLDDVTVQAPCRHREAFLMIPGRFA